MEDSAVMKRLLVLLGSATLVAVAAPAQADPPPNNDADFLQQLTAAGLTYQDPAKAVAVAKSVCQLVDKGTPDTEIEKSLTSNNGFTGNGAAKFMMLAAGEYCPKYLTGEGRPPKPPGAKGN